MAGDVQTGAVGDLSASEAAEREMILAQGGRLSAVMRTVEAGTWPPGMLADVWRWACWLVIVRGFRGDTTAQSYVRRVAALGAWLVERGHSDWTAVRLWVLEDWVKALYMQQRHGKSARSVAVAAAKSFYRWRASRGHRDCSYGLHAPKLDRRLPRRFSPAELRRIFEAVAAEPADNRRLRDRALLLLLLATGLRREEVSRLTLRDVNFDGRVAVIRVQGKGAKEREVAFEGPAVKALLEYLDHRAKANPTTDALFVALRLREPGAMNVGSVERIVKRYARRAATRWHGVHVFRVTFATALYDDGTDIERIRIVMGHESIETTRGYLAVSNRQRSVRLAPTRQHAALGTAPAGMPRWARALEGLTPEDQL